MRVGNVVKCALGVMSLLVVCALVVTGCTDRNVTNTNVDSKDSDISFKLVNGKTLSQFVVTEYLKRSDYEASKIEFLKNNENLAKSRGSNNNDAILYILDNIHLFVDEALINSIVSEGMLLYDISGNDGINLTEIVHNYFDVRSEYGGINLVGFDLHSTAMKLVDFFIDPNVYTADDLGHLTSFIDYLSNDNIPIETIKSMLEENMQNSIFSEEYRMFLSYAMNTTTFYSNSIGLSSAEQKLFVITDILITNPTILALPGDGTGQSCNCKQYLSQCFSNNSCDYMKSIFNNCNCPPKGGGGTGGGGEGEDLTWWGLLVFVLCVIFF